MKIAIAGFGLEGRSNYDYFKNKYPDAEFIIFDENEKVDNLPDSINFVSGSDAFEKIKGFDLVLRTAGLAPNKIGQIENHWSSTREFFAECPAKIIGVTGSKGKGTTCSFIVEILKQHFLNSASDKTSQVHLLGNIGVPALEVLSIVNANDVVVYEMSSFQLWDLEESPDIAVMTLIEPDHLDVHKNIDEYIGSKSRIFSYQNENDIAVYNQDDITVTQLAGKSKGVKIPFLNTKFVHISQGKIYYGETEICDSSVISLPGGHNLRNAAAAISATWSLLDGDVESIAKGLGNFKGLPHRIKFVREINGVRFYDDSIATTPGSVIAAMESFDGPKILIVGGHDKGADYSELGRVAGVSNVKIIYTIGSNRDKVYDQINKNSDVELKKLDSKTMSEIVKTVYSDAALGDTVILSPAAASFDMFRDYKDRGDQFIKSVNEL